MHVRESVVSTSEAVGEFFVIETNQVQDGGMQVVNMTRNS